jgi:hypothetical protein
LYINTIEFYDEHFERNILGIWELQQLQNCIDVIYKSVALIIKRLDVLHKINYRNFIEKTSLSNCEKAVLNNSLTYTVVFISSELKESLYIYTNFKATEINNALDNLVELNLIDVKNISKYSDDILPKKLWEYQPMPINDRLGILKDLNSFKVEEKETFETLVF